MSQSKKAKITRQVSYIAGIATVGLLMSTSPVLAREISTPAVNIDSTDSVVTCLATSLNRSKDERVSISLKNSGGTVLLTREEVVGPGSTIMLIDTLRSGVRRCVFSVPSRRWRAGMQLELGGPTTYLVAE